MEEKNNLENLKGTATGNQIKWVIYLANEMGQIFFH